mgnify:CR=1 FL=1
MKILIINHSPLIGSGSGIYTMNIAKALRKKGNDIRVITAANSLEFPDMGDIKIRPIFFKYKDNIEGQIEFCVPCFDQYPTSDLVFYDMSETQLNKYKNRFREVLEKEIENFKPDIIHTQHIWIWSSIVTEYNVPTVITSHGSDMMGYNIDNSFGKYCRKAINECDKIITISKKNNQVVLENFPEAENKCITLKNGYDTNVFYLKKFEKQSVLNEFNIHKKYDKIVLFAGRLTENKGIDVLLNATKKYENGKILTIIAGGGGLLEELKSQVTKLKLKDVVFVGDQSQENLNKLYNIADVLAVPSRIEGFGLVAIEALACGTPVVATNKGGMTDFINDEVGALVDVEDDVMLEKEISKILNEEKIFNREKLSNYAKENYSQEAVTKDLIDVYKKVLEKSIRMEE